MYIIRAVKWMPEFLFYSSLVYTSTSNNKYYSKTTKCLCNRKGPTHKISFNVKHQLAMNLRLNSF